MAGMTARKQRKVLEVMDMVKRDIESAGKWNNIYLAMINNHYPGSELPADIIDALGEHRDRMLAVLADFRARVEAMPITPTIPRKRRCRCARCRPAAAATETWLRRQLDGLGKEEA